MKHVIKLWDFKNMNFGIKFLDSVKFLRITPYISWTQPFIYIYIYIYIQSINSIFMNNFMLQKIKT